MRGRIDSTYIAGITRDGLSGESRLGRESSGSCCEEREGGCDEVHDEVEVVVLMDDVGDLGCS